MLIRRRAKSRATASRIRSYLGDGSDHRDVQRIMKSEKREFRIFLLPHSSQWRIIHRQSEAQATRLAI
jgi:hypothetical protein